MPTSVRFLWLLAACLLTLPSVANAQEPRTLAGLKSKVHDLIAGDSLFDQYTQVPDTNALHRYVQCSVDKKTCNLVGARLLLLVKVSKLTADSAQVSLLLYEPVDKLDGSGKQVGVTSIHWTMVYMGDRWTRARISSIIH